MFGLLGILFLIFFFNDTATTEIYTLSLHDALPIFRPGSAALTRSTSGDLAISAIGTKDRKSTRLNSSHGYISYAVFCLKKTTHRSVHRIAGQPSNDVAPNGAPMSDA